MTGFPPAVRHFGDVAHDSRKPHVEAPPPRRDPAPEAISRRPVVVRLWLPLTPILLLLAPFALLLIPVLYFAPRRWRVEPFAAVLGLGGLLLSLSGTDVDVRTPDAIVRIRIF